MGMELKSLANVFITNTIVFHRTIVLTKNITD